MMSHARQAPVRAIRNVTKAGPPIATHRIVGAVAWLMTSRPHGNPQGQRARTASTATHQPATAKGQARSLSRNNRPTVRIAKTSVSATASAVQTYHATLTSQVSSGKKNARPNPAPAIRAVLTRCRHTATVSSAGPMAASGQMPTGGKAATSSSPPAPASSTASAGRSRRARAEPGAVAAASTAGLLPISSTVPPAKDGRRWCRRFRHDRLRPAFSLPASVAWAGRASGHGHLAPAAALRWPRKD